MHRSLVLLVSAPILVALASGCSPADDSDEVSGPTTATTALRLSAEMATLEVLGADPQFWTFLELAERAGIADDLDGDAAVTLIAPSSDAFAQLDPAALDAIMAEAASARELVQTHIIAERLDYEALQARTEVETMTGITLPVTATEEAVTVGGATITKHDIETRNAVIHVADAVIDVPDS